MGLDEIEIARRRLVLENVAPRVGLFRSGTQQGHLRYLRIGQPGRRGGQVGLDHCVAIEIVENTNDLIANGPGSSVMPVLAQRAGQARHRGCIPGKPEREPAVQTANGKFGRFHQQMAQVVEHAEVKRVCRVRRLRKRCVVAPGALVEQGIARWSARAVLGDEKAAEEGQQIRMLLVALVEKMQISLIECETSQKERNSLALLDISQQPRVITLARSRVRQICEVYLKLIIDTLSGALVQLAAVEKERVAARLGRSEDIPFHKLHRAKTRAEDEHKSEDGDNDQRTVRASPAASKHR